MGATVTTGKASRAFQKDGKTIYILSESTYEKNCYPHTPRWNVIAFGDYETVLTRVFSHAAACDGGMLQGKSGWITSAGYIKGWRDAIANSSEDINHTESQSVTLACSESMYDPIGSSNLDFVLATLKDHDYLQTADAIAAGEKITLNVVQDLEVLLALFGTGKGRLSPWTIFGGNGYHSKSPSFDLGIPAASLAKPRLTPIEFVKTPCGTVQFVREGKTLINSSRNPWRYADAFIGNTEALLTYELQSPGCAENIIRQFKAMEAQAGILPDDTLIAVHLAEGVDPYWGITRLLEKFAPNSEKQFEFTFGQIKDDANMVWTLTNLDPEQVSYTLNSEPNQVQPKAVKPKLANGMKVKFAEPLNFGAFEEDTFIYELDDRKSRFISAKGGRCRISNWKERDYSILN